MPPLFFLSTKEKNLILLITIPNYHLIEIVRESKTQN
jgi:hypothetical protein